MDSNAISWPVDLPTPLLGRTIKVDPRSWMTKMESNRSRVRRSHDGPLRIVEATWNFTQDQYHIFVEFFVNDLQQGTLPFSMETLENDDDPSMMRQVTRELGFLEGGYSWTQQDFLFVVEAELEIDAETFDRIENPLYVSPYPPPPPTPFYYETDCRDVFSISWKLAPDFETGDDIIQCSENRLGPWYDFIVAVPTEEQLVSRNMTVRVSNTFNRNRWFRVRRKGSVYFGAARPLASVVAPPEDIEVTNTTVSEVPLGDSPFGKAVSYIENPWVNPSDIYVEIQQRLEYNQGYQYSGNNTIVSAIATTEGSHVRWTTNLSDPSLDMVWPPPKYEGEEYNARVYAPGFSGALMLRCFKGSCRSPLKIVVIDKIHNVDNYFRPVGKAASLFSSCDTPREDGSESGVSCNLNYGGTAGFESFLQSYACENMAGPSSIGKDPEGFYYLWKKTKTSRAGMSFHGWWWPNWQVSVLKFLSDDLDITESQGQRGYWDHVPRVWERLRFQITGTDLILMPVVSPEDSTHLAGIGGSAVYHAEVLKPLLLAFVPTCSDAASEQSSASILRMELVISAWWDSPPTLLPFAPQTPVQPEPPIPDPIDVFYENWESYVDGSVFIQSLSEGTGWDGNWTIRLLTLIDGWDLFTDYSDGVVTTADGLSLGEAWDGSWVFNDIASYMGYELWEDYSDSVITAENVTDLRGGHLWSLLLDGSPEYGQDQWVIVLFAVGKEDWESYSDGEVTTEDNLNYSDETSWIASDPWIFNFL